MQKSAFLIATIKVIAHPAFQGAVAILGLFVAVVGLVLGLL